MNQRRRGRETKLQIRPGRSKGFARQDDALYATLGQPALSSPALTCLASDTAAMIPRKIGTVVADQDMDSGQWSPTGRGLSTHVHGNCMAKLWQANDYRCCTPQRAARGCGGLCLLEWMGGLCPCSVTVLCWFVNVFLCGFCQK
jgi:hypothetical protein